MLRELGQKAQLVLVAVADQQEHAVWVALFELHHQLHEANGSIALVAGVAAKHKKAAVLEKELGLRGIVPLCTRVSAELEQRLSLTITSNTLENPRQR